MGKACSTYGTNEKTLKQFKANIENLKKKGYLEDLNTDKRLV
jgi:hypothetical protein